MKNLKKTLNLKMCFAAVLGLMTSYAIADHHGENHVVPAKEKMTGAHSVEKSRGKTVSQDASMDKIKKAQAKLQEKGLLQKQPSGVVDEETRSALSKFQKENNLDQTGTLDNPTLAKLGVEGSEKKVM